MVTMVLLNVALMWATPRLTLRRCLRFLLLATVECLCRIQRRAGAGSKRAHTGRLRALPRPGSLAFLHTLLARDGLARPLAGPGVGSGPLPAHRQAAPVPDAPVAADVLEAG